MKKNRIITKKQARRNAYVKGIVIGFVSVFAVFSAPKIWESYRSAQKEQLAKVKARMQERKFQEEFETKKAAVLRAEREDAARVNQSIIKLNKQMKAELREQDAELQKLWAKGIYPEGNEDADCGKCLACKAKERTGR